VTEKPREASRPHEQTTSDVAPAPLAGGVDLDAWASRLLDGPGRVLEARGAKVVALVEGASEPVVSGAEWDSCPCCRFQRLARSDCSGRPRCRHTLALAKLRRAMAAQEERAARATADELRRVAAEDGSRKVERRDAPSRVPARARLEAQRD